MNAQDGEALVSVARSLAPTIADVADRIERERQLPAELVDALVDAGLFSMLAPRSLWGVELDLPTYVCAIEELARADASVAWCVGQANGLYNYFSYAEPSVAQEVFAGGRVILANGPGEENRPGHAVCVDGGYRISGRWMFASGITHATWMLAICQLPDRSDQTRLMLIPKDRVAVHDVWQVSGLRGTGSQSFSVEDLFVPASYAIDVRPESRAERGPLYLFSSSGLFGPTFGAVALGVAHASLEAIIDFATGKVPRGMNRSIRENATVQASVGLAEARLGAARAFLHTTLTEVWEAVVRAGELTLDQQVRVRLAGTHATHEACAVVDTAYGLAGSNAIFEDRPFERRFRDVHAVAQQLQGRRAHYETVGAYLLGLEPPRTFL